VSSIRLCHRGDVTTMLAIINGAAEAYRGKIPADCWHEPYMPREELEHELNAGVTFWGIEHNSELTGIMGLQPMKDVELIRHAYVAPSAQSRGIGSTLLTHLKSLCTRPILVGTWAAAEWAIRFYQRHGFELATPREKTELLQKYWTVSLRQIETSVVLTLTSA
jgi:N-acetylglutamate synthase-like GNAT family acetyltransferase